MTAADAIMLAALTAVALAFCAALVRQERIRRRNEARESERELRRSILRATGRWQESP